MATTIDPDVARAFADRTWEAAGQAVRSGGPERRSVCLAGRSMRLDSAGPAPLRHLWPAFSHRAADDDAESHELTVRLVCTRTSGVGPPEPRWAWDHHLSRGQVPGFAGGDVFAAFEPVWGGLTLVDRERGRAVFWVRDADELPSWERAAPLRTVLHAWLPAHDTRLVHAGAVGRDGIGVLLVGRGGSGKSTSCLTCLLAGMSYVGDDYVAVTSDTAYNLYRTAKLDPDQLVRAVPQLRDHAVRQTTGEVADKTTILLDVDDARVVERLRLGAIVVPTVRIGAPTVVSPTPRAAALRSLAPSTIFQQPGEEASAFAFMSELVRGLPAYELVLGGDPADVPAAIDGLLEVLS